jgi:tetrahydromethanopterin S-methyltransferase subunit C
MDLEFRTIKILDIGYITIIYFILGLLISRLFDSYLGKYDKLNDDKKHPIRVGAELIIIIWVIGATVYLTRNIVELIPSPFHGLYGFDHFQLISMHLL